MMTVAGDPTTGNSQPPRLSTLSKYILLSLTWGASFLFIKIGLEGLSPTQVVLGRLLGGASTLGLLCAVTGRRLPREIGAWGHLVITAVVFCVVPFTLFAWAEDQHVSSGLASVYNATTPLMAVLVSLVALRTERPTILSVVGVGAGFVGVLVILNPWAGVPSGDLKGNLACLAATTCYGIGYVHLRRSVIPRGLDALTVATMQVGLGAVIALALAPWNAFTPVDLSPRVIGAILALGAVGTGLAYVWNTSVILAWGSTAASTVTYLSPVVGVGLGALVFQENVAWHELAGGLIVLLGIAVGNRQTRLSPSASEAAA